MKKNEIILQLKHFQLFLLNIIMIFSFWIDFIFFKLEPHKRVWKNKDSCHVIMPSEDTKMWEFSQYQKSDKASFIIYCLECIIEKIDGCNKNPENSSKTKLNILHQLFQCLQYLHLEGQKTSMIYTEVKIAWKRYLKEHAMKMINFKKK